MDITTILKQLEAIDEADGGVVTLTLDLASTGKIPAEARVFMKKEFEGNLASEARPAALQTLLKKLSRRIQAFVEKDLNPNTKGLYLVAGRKAWLPVELQVPLRNFVTVGRRPFTLPLLAAEAAHPRAYLVEMNARQAVIRELHLGDAAVLKTLDEGATHEPQQRTRTSRSKAHLSTGPGSGGSARDREQQRQEQSGRSLHHHAADAVNELHRLHPAAAVYLAGPQDAFGEFADRLTPELKARAQALGSRNDADLKLARRQLKMKVADLQDRRLLDFHERRAQGLQAALGPRDVLDRLYAGQLERIYLDEYDAIPGVLCTGCGAREPGLGARCPFCSEDVVPTSIAQDIVMHGRKHPPLELVFVGPQAKWLDELGGLAGLVHAQGAPRRTSPALR
jgi:hypothetical protein